MKKKYYIYSYYDNNFGYNIRPLLEKEGILSKKDSLLEFSREYKHYILSSKKFDTNFVFRKIIKYKWKRSFLYKFEIIKELGEVIVWFDETILNLPPSQYRIIHLHEDPCGNFYNGMNLNKEAVSVSLRYFINQFFKDNESNID